MHFFINPNYSKRFLKDAVTDNYITTILRNTGCIAPWL